MATLDEDEVASTEEEEKKEEVAVKKILNIMENVSNAEEKDISSTPVKSARKKGVKVVFKKLNIIKTSTIDLLETTSFFNCF